MQTENCKKKNPTNPSVECIIWLSVHSFFTDSYIFEKHEREWMPEYPLTDSYQLHLHHANHMDGLYVMSFTFIL